MARRMSIAERDDRDWVRTTLEDRGERYDPLYSVAFKLEAQGLGPEGLPWTPDYVNSTPVEPLTYSEMLQLCGRLARELHEESGGAAVYLTVCAYTAEREYLESPDPELVVEAKGAS